MLEATKSKINLIFEQFILNIQSVELFFKKFSIQALEEDKSILESKRDYMEKVFKKALGEEAFEKVEDHSGLIKVFIKNIDEKIKY